MYQPWPSIAVVQADCSSLIILVFLCYRIYPKYWDTSTSYHMIPKVWKKSILLHVDVSKLVLDEWQTV